MALLSLFYLVAGSPAVRALNNNNNPGAKQAEAIAESLRYLAPTEDEERGSSSASILGKAATQDT
jgi:hypothetical protein